jgi:hypothetical protein
MVAIAQEDADVRAGKAAQLRREIQAGVEVRPVAVEDVAGDQHEIGRALDGEVDDVGEGAAGGVAHLFGGSAVVEFEAAQRAVEVNVGAVDEAHGPPVGSMNGCSPLLPGPAARRR